MSEPKLSVLAPKVDCPHALFKVLQIGYCYVTQFIAGPCGQVRTKVHIARDSHMMNLEASEFLRSRDTQ